MKAFANAANKAKSLESEALVKALKTTSIESPQGALVMDSNSHHAQVNSYLAQCQYDGTFEIIQRFGVIAPIIPELYRSKEDLDSGLNKPGENTAIDNVTGEDESKSQEWTLLGLIDHVEIDGGKGLQHQFNLRYGELQAETLACIYENVDVVCAVLSLGKSCVISADEYVKKSGNKNLKIVYLNKTFNGYEFALYAGNADEELDVSQQILEIADSAILAMDESGKVIQANSTACILFGFKMEEIIGASLEQMIPPRYRRQHKGHFTGFLVSDEWQRLMMTRKEISGYRKDGSEFPAEVSIAKFYTEGEILLVATVRDISERKEAEAHLTWQATHDPLTGLPNRALIHTRLENALSRSISTNNPLALLFVDIDDFKLINDSYGHNLGDKLLKTTAKRLIKAVRPGDTVARFGGDEFIVLVDNLTDIDAMNQITEKVVSSLREPMLLDGMELYPTASVGMAIGYGSSHSAEDLLKNADSAMYGAKAKGRNGWLGYSDDMREKSLLQLKIGNGLRNSIRNNELSVFFQPIVNVQNRNIVGAEALLRWKHKGESISPVHFIPVAEMTGSICDIGLWVFKQVCQFQSIHSRQLEASGVNYLSVNVSARQLLDRELVTQFSSILEETGADANRILLEVTETALMKDVDTAMAILNDLGGRGLKLAIDDFGTGYSSLEKLVKLPVDSIKIDKVFVDGMIDSHESEMVVKAIINMAQILNKWVIAEGVESEDQYSILAELRCDNIQGYLFYKPMPIDDFLALLN